MNTVYLFNADDFGWTDGHNLAVERAHLQGVLNRASLMCNGLAFEDAIQIAGRLPNLMLGVHLTLLEGAPLLPPEQLQALTDGRGVFFDEVNSLAHRWLSGSLPVDQARAEWAAQLERALDARVPVTHLDSHKHIHLLPPLLDAAISLAQEYHIPYLRLPLERLSGVGLRRGPAGLVLWLLARRARPRTLAAGLTFADHFVGIGVSGAMTTERMEAVLRLPPNGLMEIMSHPAVITPAVAALQQRYAWAAHYQFEEELNALCTVRLPQTLPNLG